MPIAIADRRVFADGEALALLIGNQGYGSEIGRLTNPYNDITLLGKALKGLGFDVTTVRDAGLGGLHQAVNNYTRRVQGAGANAVGFFYYSGHGAADASVNYLIPVDVKTTDAGELWDQSLRLTEITRKLKTEAGNATHFVVFDACRNTLKLTRAGSRAVVQSKGFVPVAQESGMLIAYATAEGELASDMGAEAGPYARALVAEIVKPGIEAVVMFRNVQRRVRAAINQEPYLGFNAMGDVYLAGAASDQAPAHLTEAAEAWDRTRDITSIAVLELFISSYKDTYYAGLARLRIEELQRQLAAVASPPPKAPPTLPAAQLMLTREPTIALLQNTEIVGSTRTFSGEQPDPDACSKQCLADASCHAFSFNAANRFCYFIDGILSQQAHASYVSGMRRSPAREHDISKSGASLDAQYSIIENVEILGSSRTFSGEKPSLDACSKQCLADPSCQAFSFNRSNRFCYLIDGLRSLNSNPSFVSARVRKRE